MKKINLTAILNRYFFKFFVRIAIFTAVFVAYLINKEVIYKAVTEPFWDRVSFIHILWLLFMLMMLFHIIPNSKLPMSLRKSQEQQFIEVPGYSELELRRFVHQQNKRAWLVMLVWLCFNGIWGALYLMGIMDEADLIMLTVFYFLSDYICILLWCPFQDFIMGNLCCTNCRIYDWGHFMMFTPMLFIRDFFSWSLFFTSCVVLIHWELVYAKHPERFWKGSNQILQCQICGDKTCQIKRGISGFLFKKIPFFSILADKVQRF